VRYVVPDVPAILLEPVASPTREVDTLRDVALLVTDYDEALGTANGRLVAVRCILDGAGTGEPVECYKKE
jgi:hypothetical protein